MAELVYVFFKIHTFSDRHLIGLYVVILASFLPLWIGELYEFYLSPSNWFLRDGDDGKLWGLSEITGRCVQTRRFFVYHTNFSKNNKKTQLAVSFY